MRELNLSYRSACLQCSLSDKEISEYILEKNRNAGHLPLKYAVAHVGHQIDGNWVMSDNCCISKEGHLISIEESQYVWIGDI